MANRAVSLYRKCKTADGWKRYPVAMSANGRVKPNVVYVAGEEMMYEQGHYELGSYRGTKRVWTRVGTNATDAAAALKTARNRAEKTAGASDVTAAVADEMNVGTLRDKANKFVSDTLARGSVEAAEVYRRSLDEFIEGCSKIDSDDLTHDDVLRFHSQLRKRGMSDRTIFNRHQNVRSFLLSLGWSTDRIKKVAGKRPKFDKTTPRVYEQDQLKTFFKALTTDYDRLFFDLLLTTGLRENEAAHIEWRDIDWTHKVIHVRSKPEWGHKIKDAEERQMPLTADLARRLKAYRKHHPNAKLIFGKRGGLDDAPDGHHLRRLKQLAKDGELNCHECDGCKELDECHEWFLHRFRATYITTLLRSGMDLRTVMKLSGHTDLASVMRYLSPASGSEIQNKVNSIRWR